MAKAPSAEGARDTANVRRAERRRSLALDLRVELHGTVPFRRTSDVRIPQFAGVYILHDLRGSLYVGRTCDLSRRFQEHETEPSNPLIALARRRSIGPLSFSWIVLADAKRRRAVEVELIHALDPPCNRCTPTLIQ